MTSTPSVLSEDYRSKSRVSPGSGAVRRCWPRGLHLGLSQRLLSALLDDTAPETFDGLFDLVTGALLIASVLTVETIGPAATFLAAAAVSSFPVLIMTEPKLVS